MLFEQRLLCLLVQYIGSHETDSRFLAEARNIGLAYGRERRAAGTSMHETIEALLRFRSTFSQLAMPVPGMTLPADLAESAALHARLDRFMDVLLLGAVAE